MVNMYPTDKDPSCNPTSSTPQPVRPHGQHVSYWQRSQLQSNLQHTTTCSASRSIWSLLTKIPAAIQPPAHHNLFDLTVYM
jgi:hypothetical protein